MYKAVIVDDDHLACKVLKRIIEIKFNDIQIVGEADSVKSGVEQITEHKPDIVFLDIELPDGTGFDIIDKLPTINFKLIFTTSYSDYAITAIKYSAFDYILKPVLPENVKSTIERIKEAPFLENKQQIEYLRSKVEGNKNEVEPTIAIPDMSGFTIIKIKNILRCEGKRNYTTVHYNNGTSVLVSRTLLEFEQLLVPHGFCRIHRSHLINLDYINRYLKSDGGTVELTDKTVVPVSPKYKDEFLEKILQNKL